MWAIEIDKFGPPQVMVKREVDEPKIEPGKVIVEVMAAGINPKDTYIRKGRLALLAGRKFPMRMGYDLSGIISDAGNGQSGFKKGDRVFGSIKNWAGGAYAEFASVNIDELAILPTSLSYEEGASLPIAALTSYQTLTRLAQTKSSDSVLINGASGGVGIFAIQIAKHLGANVTTLSSAANLDFCLSLGADSALDYKATSVKNLTAKFDTIFDAFGNHSFSTVKHLLNDRGIYVTTVPRVEIFKDMPLTLFGKKARLVIVESNNLDLTQIANLASTGAIKTVIEKQFSFDQAALAHRHSETHRTRGKIVLTRA